MEPRATKICSFFNFRSSFYACHFTSVIDAIAPGGSFGRDVIDIIDIRASPAKDHPPLTLYFHDPEQVTFQALN
jgi:hypothetical protein